MSRLWIIVGSLLTAVVVSVASFGVLNALAHEEETATYRFDAAGIERIDVDGRNGTVEIRAGDTDTITVDADISHGLRKTEYSAEVAGDTVAIRASCPKIPVQFWCRVSYTVTAPRGIDVDVDNRNGSVTVAGMTGDVRVQTSNGPIEASGLTGDATLETSNGSVRADEITSPRLDARSSNGPVQLFFVAAPEAVDTSTSNGSIEIEIPDDGEAYRLDLHTSIIGSTESPIRTDPGSDRSITARTSNGPITVRYPT